MLATLVMNAAAMHPLQLNVLGNIRVVVRPPTLLFVSVVFVSKSASVLAAPTMAPFDFAIAAVVLVFVATRRHAVGILVILPLLGDVVKEGALKSWVFVIMGHRAAWLGGSDEGLRCDSCCCRCSCRRGSPDLGLWFHRRGRRGGEDVEQAVVWIHGKPVNMKFALKFA